MPPRWPRKPTREDPDYRRLEDRMNFALHTAACIAVNSGLWFFHTLNPSWVTWVSWLTLAWVGILAAHGIYIFVLADYSPRGLSPLPNPNEQGDS